MNRKPIALALAALLGLAVALPAAPAAASEPENTVYLALGDSLAQGWGNTTLEKYPYVPRFYNFLQAGHHSSVGQLTNLGYGGETSTSFITGVLPGHPTRNPSQLGQALMAIADPAMDVSVVTFDIGGNDLLGLMQGPCADPNDPGCVPAAMQAIGLLAQNYAYSLLNVAGALGADPGEERFIVMTYYNPWSGTGSPYEGVVEMMLLGADQTVDCTHFGDPNYAPYFGVNDVLACTPAYVGLGSLVSVADVYPRFVGKGAELTYVSYNNNIHPNNAGYAQIANVFRDTYLNR